MLQQKHKKRQGFGAKSTAGKLTKSRIATSCSEVKWSTSILKSDTESSLVKNLMDHGTKELPCATQKISVVKDNVNDSNDVQEHDSSSDSDDSTSGPQESERQKLQRQRQLLLNSQLRWLPRNHPSMLLHYAEFNVSNNGGFDVNNNSQGLDMQNLPSIAEQMERQKTWMTVNFRYRMNWFEAKPHLEKMPRDKAYKSSNLPLWTRCVKVQLHRKSIFLHAVRAFRNRMQCATSGVRFCMYAFYRPEKKGEHIEGPESKPLPYFRCPDDMPEIKTMIAAQMNVFVSNSTSYFDKFWEESLKEKNS